MAEKNSYKAEITLPSDRELVVKRVFDAPRHLVYQAWTDTQLEAVPSATASCASCEL